MKHWILLFILLFFTMVSARIEIDTLSISPEPIDTTEIYTYEPVNYPNGETLPITGEKGIYRVTFPVKELNTVHLPALYFGASPYPVQIRFNGNEVFRWGHSLSDFRMQTVRPFTVPLHSKDADSGTVEILFYTQGQKTAFRTFWIDSEEIVTNFVFFEDMIGADGIKTISALSLLLGILIISYYFLSKKRHPEILYLGLFAFFEGIGYTLFITDGAGMGELFWYKFSRPGFPLAMAFLYSATLRLLNITSKKHLTAERIFYLLSILVTIAIWSSPSMFIVAQIFSYFAGVGIIYPIFGIIITLLFKTVFLDKKRESLLLFIGFCAVILTSSIDLYFLLADKIPYAWFSAYGQFIHIFFIIITIGKHEQRMHEQLLQMTLNLQNSNKELKKAHQQIARESELRENFIKAVSHELRTPLNAAVGIVQELADKSVEHYSIFAASINRLRLAITNIFTYESLDKEDLALTLTPIDLGEICHEIASYHSETAINKGVKLSVEYEYDNPFPERILSSESAWELIINNTISNAVKFTDSGCVKVTLSYRDGRVYFDVSDTGCGVPESELATIFEEFSASPESNRYTKKSNQIGIGLRITKQQIDLLNGTIAMENREDQGSAVHVQVPATKVNSPHSQTITQKQLGSKILVVDDNDTNHLILAAILRKAGLEYEMTFNGLQAVDEIVQRGSQYCLILMDIQMPIMNGIDASRKIREIGYTGTIIALTANADRNECIEAGMNDYLEKPYTKQTLISLIDRYIGNSSEENVQ